MGRYIATSVGIEQFGPWKPDDGKMRGTSTLKICSLAGRGDLKLNVLTDCACFSFIERRWPE